MCTLCLCALTPRLFAAAWRCRLRRGDQRCQVLTWPRRRSAPATPLSNPNPLLPLYPLPLPEPWPTYCKTTSTMFGRPANVHQIFICCGVRQMLSIIKAPAFLPSNPKNNSDFTHLSLAQCDAMLLLHHCIGPTIHCPLSSSAATPTLSCPIKVCPDVKCSTCLLT
jgi:hypothetical protein